MCIRYECVVNPNFYEQMLNNKVIIDTLKNIIFIESLVFYSSTGFV